MRYSAFALDSDSDDSIGIRCTVCGKCPPRFGCQGDSVMLSDLTDWADSHRCAPLSVT